MRRRAMLVACLRALEGLIGVLLTDKRIKSRVCACASTEGVELGSPSLSAGMVEVTGSGLTTKRLPIESVTFVEFLEDDSS